MRAVALLAFCSLPLAAVSCAPELKSALIGKWRNAAGSTIEFRADGTAVLTDATRSAEVTYRFRDSETVEFLGSSGKAVGHLTIHSVGADELDVTNHRGTREKCRRVK
jgi:hypothetical protein